MVRKRERAAGAAQSTLRFSHIVSAQVRLKSQSCLPTIFELSVSTCCGEGVGMIIS